MCPLLHSFRFISKTNTTCQVLNHYLILTHLYFWKNVVYHNLKQKAMVVISKSKIYIVKENKEGGPNVMTYNKMNYWFKKISQKIIKSK